MGIYFNLSRSFARCAAIGGLALVTVGVTAGVTAGNAGAATPKHAGGGAITARDKPSISTPRNFKQLPGLTDMQKDICVQRARIGNDSYGFNSMSALRRASALAHIRAAQGNPTEPVSAISIANYEVGTDFDLMVMIAVIESRMGLFDQPLLGGSARGLFHFMPATWLTLFSWFGAEYNNGVFADAAKQIKFDERKQPYVDDQDLKAAILNLRSDPYVASFIKAKQLMHDERPVMLALLGREPTHGDYYLVHFLGLDRARVFYKALRKNPGKPSGKVFPKESADPNNRPLFFKGKKPYTMRQTYEKITGMVSRTLTRVNGNINLALANESCIKPLVLTQPGYQPIVINAPVTAPPIDAPKPGVQDGDLPAPGEKQIPEPTMTVPPDPREKIPDQIPEVPDYTP